MAGLMVGWAFCAVAVGANAASTQIGVKGGVAMQTLEGEGLDSYNVENRTGFVGGAFVQSDFSKNFGVRLEALYFMKGAAGDSADIEVTLKLDYFEVPVLLVGNLPVSETARIGVFAGPTFGFNTGADAELSVGGFTASADIGDSVKSFDMGLTFGAGITFDLGQAILGFDGRYGFGFDTVLDADAASDEGITLDDEDDVKNQGYAFMVQIGFPLGGSD
jgi:hypothetical protein